MAMKDYAKRKQSRKRVQLGKQKAKLRACKKNFTPLPSLGTVLSRFVSSSQ